MYQYLLKSLGQMMFRFKSDGELVCKADGLSSPDIFVPASGLPPWIRKTVLTTKGGPNTFFDGQADQGDLPQLFDDGVVVQGLNGLEIPTGLVGASPDGFWKLGDKSLAEASNIPAALRAAVIMQKPVSTGAIAGMRLFGWAKSDFTAFLMVGLVGPNWEYHTLVNGNLRIHNLGAATTQGRFLHGLLSPSGTMHAKPQGYAYNLPAGQIKDIDIEAMSGGLTTVASPNQDPLADWVAAIGDGSDWYPTLRIDGYQPTDDAVVLAVAHV